MYTFDWKPEGYSNWRKPASSFIYLKKRNKTKHQSNPIQNKQTKTKQNKPTQQKLHR